MDGGCWGAATASQHQEFIVALASLILAKRYDMALLNLDKQLGDYVSTDSLAKSY
tara:strand:- start:5811 stop:5975 length:165 start_codon:yes stop_codon:yes gene_type:complete